MRGRRAVEWRLVDAVYPRSRFGDEVARRARELTALSDRPRDAQGIALGPLAPRTIDDRWDYSAVTLKIDRPRRRATVTVRAPEAPQPDTPDAIVRSGDQFWPLRAFRELDDAILRLRLNEPEIGTVLLQATGDAEGVLAVDRTLAAHRDHWLVREIVLYVKRTLKRVDLTSRSFFALIEAGTAFAGTLFELALASDRSYMLDDPTRPCSIALSDMNDGAYPMGSGLSRLEVRFLGEPHLLQAAVDHDGPFTPRQALEAGLVSFAPDELDWDDEVRLALEERAALSPDALTGMEASLRFAGADTLETMIFSLTAWQNWIFQRPNAVGEHGALTTHGRHGRPKYDWHRC
jgi:benzoyl-CoA-dihydrodiol lyase